MLLCILYIQPAALAVQTIDGKLAACAVDRLKIVLGGLVGVRAGLLRFGFYNAGRGFVGSSGCGFISQVEAAERSDIEPGFSLLLQLIHIGHLGPSERDGGRALHDRIRRE